MFLVIGFVALLLLPNPQAHAEHHADWNATQVVSHVSPMKDSAVVRISFNVANGNYVSFLDDLHQVLVGNPARRNVHGVPVLPPQRKDIKPARWIHVKLTGRNTEKAAIAMRDDNMYMVGFANYTGHWYVFSNRRNLMPDAIALPFEDGYRDLVGGYDKLPNYFLGKDDALQAVSFLAFHTPTIPLHDDQLRVSFAKLSLMIAEAKRFKQIADTVSQGWESKTSIGASQARRLVLWSKISYSLLYWDKTTCWVDKGGVLADKGGITGPCQALEVLRILLWPYRFTFSTAVDPQTKACGVPCN